MQYELIHPREQLQILMKRIYRYGMTTTSGGNMSILDDKGDICITPTGVDKGALTWDDILQVKANGNVKGRHQPSSEFLFHKTIYEVRPDIRGIVHAHPSTLVSYSIVRKIPPIKIIPQANEVCGQIGFASYALPGSKKLGQNIASTFEAGIESVMMENHGVVCGGKNLLHAFQRFETLDFCARLAIKAIVLGGYHELNDHQLSLFYHTKNELREFYPEYRSNRERVYRRHICEIVHRAYEQQMMTSTEGVVSVRLDKDSFLITPTSKDRKLLNIVDVVLIHHAKRELGKLPSRSVLLHDRIYKDHPEIQSIMSAQAPSATAFSVSEELFNTRTIPESYILLRDIPKISYGPQYTDEQVISDRISENTPVVLQQNDAVLTVGSTLLEAFERLEVAEFSARSLIDAKILGGLIAINEHQIRKIKLHYLNTN